MTDTLRALAANWREEAAMHERQGGFYEQRLSDGHADELTAALDALDTQAQEAATPNPAPVSSELLVDARIPVTQATMDVLVNTEVIQLKDWDEMSDEQKATMSRENELLAAFIARCFVPGAPLMHGGVDAE